MNVARKLEALLFLYMLMLEDEVVECEALLFDDPPALREVCVAIMITFHEEELARILIPESCDLLDKTTTKALFVMNKVSEDEEGVYVVVREDLRKPSEIGIKDLIRNCNPMAAEVVRLPPMQIRAEQDLASRPVDHSSAIEDELFF